MRPPGKGRPSGNWNEWAAAREDQEEGGGTTVRARKVTNVSTRVIMEALAP